MGRPRHARPVKLICGLLAQDQDVLRRARQILVRRFGPADAESEMWPFTQTDYYDDEMGKGLTRWFLAFERLIRADELSHAKLDTNRIESELAEQLAALEIPRPINIDPGYVDPGKLVLASTKDHAHRVYLGNGIFGEVTLAFMHGAWTPWPWTYPDYKTPHYAAFFTRVRDRLREQAAQIERNTGQSGA